ncbi:MAG: SulP family inorganic anion transporter [Legionella sp.]
MKTIIESYKAGLFAKKFWIPNIISGVIVGVVALPLAMAFAIASGAKPEQGLYTAIVAGFLVSIFGGSRLQIAGPTGAFVVVLAGITAKYGIDGLQIATLLAGFILIGFGIAKLGAVIKFIPAPVIVGFTAGIAVVIWVGQWQYFFGFPATHGTHFHEKFWQSLLNLSQSNINTTSLSLLSLGIMLYSNRISMIKRLPGPLVALIVGTVLQSLFHFSGVATIGSAFGGIPQGLPNFHLPNITADKIIELIGPAFTIAMLGAIESLLSAVVADGMADTRHESNRELIGQGIANVITPLFGGFAATGAIARTATNIRNGGTSPLAGIIHSLSLVLIIIFLAPLATNVPLATLAAILFVVSWNMGELPHVVKLMKRAPRADIAILWVTFLLTVLIDLVVAVNIGVILAILHFLLKMSRSIEINQLTNKEIEQELTESLPPIPQDVMVYSIDGPFFFGAVESFEHALATIDINPRVLIIRLRWVPYIDITGIQTLEDLIIDLHQRGVRVLLTGANMRVVKKLHKAGIIELVGKENIYTDLAKSIASSYPPQK